MSLGVTVIGRYRLNLSLIRLDLETVSQLPETPDKHAEEERALRLGLSLVAPDAIEAPAWLLDAEPSLEFKSRALLLALWHLQELQNLPSQIERRSYVQGALDAHHFERGA